MMGEYEDIMTLIENEHETFLGTATQYVPRLRKALENAKPDITKEEIKERIKADCKKYWTTETIMNALGDDFKNKVFVNAGKKKAQTQNTPSNHSRVSDKEIIIDTSGKPITEDPDSENLSIQNAKEKLNKIYPDIDEDEEKENTQIQINDLQTQLENERSERIRLSQLLDKEREKNKDSNFKPASELVKPAINPDDDTSPVLRSVYKKTIGELNTRILELKDQLNEVQKYDEVIEIKNQKIALVIEATNLKSVTVDEAKSRRLN